MERTTAKDQGSEVTIDRRRLVRSLIIMFFIWAGIGIALGSLADTVVAAFAAIAWSAVVLGFGCWAIYRIFWRLT